jgi:hypothetical protein
MNKSTKYHKTDFKNKKKFNNNNGYLDEENLSFKEVRRDKESKHYRNYDNALRSKNVDRLLSYEEE